MISVGVGSLAPAMHNIYIHRKDIEVSTHCRLDLSHSGKSRSQRFWKLALQQLKPPGRPESKDHQEKVLIRHPGIKIQELSFKAAKGLCREATIQSHHENFACLEAQVERTCHYGDPVFLQGNFKTPVMSAS